MNTLNQRTRTTLVRASLVFVIGLSIVVVGCVRSQNSPDPAVPQNAVFSSTPPFSTKEPEHYQATRSITFTETTGAVNATRTTNVLIARDGQQRREEYEAGTLGTIVYLESVAGRFVLLPRPKLYANPGEVNGDLGLSRLAVEAEMMSPDYLLNDTKISAQYQKLGTDTIAGRTATKYRVDANSSVKTETFIWVDETLGMPIASQSISTDAESSMRVSMELRDIRTEVDPGLFALPADYRQVPASQIRELMRAAIGSVRER